MEGRTTSAPVLVVGIDEAGYGPVLGPLVVSAAAFEVPAVAADVPLWRLLRESVTTSPRPRDRRVPIIDSKKLYQRSNGLATLERTALAAVGAWRSTTASSSPGCFRELLSFTAPHVAPDLAGYPWYCDADPRLPVEADAGGVRIAAAMLARSAAKKGVKLAGIWCEPLPEGHFNRLVANTQNKSTVALGLVLRLMQRVSQAFPTHEIHFWIDKQGGRDHYREPLMRAFEDRTMRIVEEGGERSVYQMPRASSAWQVGFCVRGESRHLPIALASIISKYVRELFMSCFNAWWQRHDPALVATAGYYGDGERFVRAINPHIERLGVDRGLLIRSR